MFLGVVEFCGDDTHAQHQETTCMADQHSDECVQTGNSYSFQLVNNTKSLEISLQKV